MAVPAGPTEQRYVGNGVSTIFTVPFLVIQASDLAVYVDGVELTSGYTQSGVENPTSSVIFTTAPPLNAQILFTLEVPFERLNDYQENGDFLANTVNNDFDRIWQALKQLMRYTNRSLRLGASDVDGAGFYRGKGNGIVNIASSQRVDTSVPNWKDVADFVAEILATGQGPINNAANVLYMGPDSLPYTVQDLSSPTNAAKGAALVGWKRSPLRSSIISAGQMLNAQAISVWEFANLITVKPDANDPDTWDWTPAFQAAFNLAIPLIGTTPGPDFARIAIMIPTGIYHLTSVEVGSKIDIYCAGGVIRPFDVAATANYVMKLTNFNRLYNLTFDMDYSVTYREALWIRGRHNHLFGCSFWKARNAMTFGDPVWATTPSLGMLGDSENILSSCETVWCVTAFHCYGQNTILHFDDCLLYSTINTLPVGDPRKAFWESLPAIVAYNWGCLVYTTGGCVANFTPLYPVFKSELQPVSGDIEYVNSFGKFFMNGTHIETGNLLEAGAVGAYVAQDVSSNVLTMQGCNGYLTSNPAFFINLGSDCRQFVSIDGTNRLYGHVSNKIIYSIGAPSYVSPIAFANLPTDFFQCVAVLHPQGYDDYCALDARQSSQAFSTSFSVFKPTTLNPSDVRNDGLLNLQTEWFNTGTGVFVAKSDMRNVIVRVSLSLSSGVAADETVFRVMLNGVQVDQAIIYGGSPSAILQVRRIPNGGSLTVEISQTQGRSANGSDANRLVISASV
ncbi:hypothetical protein AB688_18315 [Pseudomonas putida]|uniref:hypothetical protein n=1 Tax=Pseudomonas putida TaxID=303 RepID=UPI0007B6BECE|nr:hypothetical protein [Pseudomonas putida]ANC03963.1 hypothetical protein AB688_18315 [Pseudomonas putida]